ncbi:MAG: Ryanodine receptor Ryr [Proteobacteria bacterium]|nr:Ryanodine receptor Ryr [Pseudomonadota bacterium]MBU1058257.1 Ryanodine receptor Ryr [Pseudomonadota bacterium]
MSTTGKKIETPFGEYKPRIASPEERMRAAAIMGDAVEAIARVNHDQWAAERIAQGWRYGRQRDDSGKLHPGLVPYEHLTDGEKQIDVEGAKAVVAELIRLGILQY